MTVLALAKPANGGAGRRQLAAYFLLAGALTYVCPALGVTQEVALTDVEQAWLDQHPAIRVGVDKAFPPVDFVDDEGVHRGLAADYLALLNQRLGTDMRAVPGLSWAQVMDGAKDGSLAARGKSL